MQYKDLIREIIGAMDASDIKALTENMDKEYVIVVLHITNAFWYPEFIYTNDTDEVNRTVNEHAEVLTTYTQNFFDEFMTYANLDKKKMYEHFIGELV